MLSEFDHPTPQLSRSAFVLFDRTTIVAASVQTDLLAAETVLMVSRQEQPNSRAFEREEPGRERGIEVDSASWVGFVGAKRLSVVDLVVAVVATTVGDMVVAGTSTAEAVVVVAEPG